MKRDAGKRTKQPQSVAQCPPRPRFRYLPLDSGNLECMSIADICSSKEKSFNRFLIPKIGVSLDIPCCGVPSFCQTCACMKRYVLTVDWVGVPLVARVLRSGPGTQREREWEREKEREREREWWLLIEISLNMLERRKNSHNCGCGTVWQWWNYCNHWQKTQ